MELLLMPCNYFRKKKPYCNKVQSLPEENCKHVAEKEIQTGHPTTKVYNPPLVSVVEVCSDLLSDLTRCEQKTKWLTRVSECMLANSRIWFINIFVSFGSLALFSNGSYRLM